MAKTHLITGGTSGIGKAVIKLLLEKANLDDRILVNYGHNDDAAQRLMDETAAERRHQIILLKSDLSDSDNLPEFIGRVSELADSIDSLILNIGVTSYESFDDYNIDEWNRIIQTNLTIPIFITQKLSSLMAKGGSVLFIGSYAGILPYSSSLVYGVSKAGINFAAKALVKEFDEREVRVNAVAPGFIETAWQTGRSDESRERINNKIALHRFGKPEEVAAAVCAVLENGYINGAVLEIHGGYNYF